MVSKFLGSSLAFVVPLVPFVWPLTPFVTPVEWTMLYNVLVLCYEASVSFYIFPSNRRIDAEEYESDEVVGDLGMVGRCIE